MPTFKITLAYDGTEFAGWQRQTNGVSIQQLVEEALGYLAGRAVRIVASGRTDAGVHALGQVASTSFETPHGPETVQRALNASLPKTIRALRVEVVPSSFHARRDARQKTYCYRLLYGATAPPFAARYAWALYGRLDEAAMAEALETLRGRHDFSAFQSAGGRVKTKVRTVNEVALGRGPLVEPWTGVARAEAGATLVTITVTADGFLRHMVRAIVGSLVEVGFGRWQPRDVATVLESRDRRRAGPSAPARGLFLVRVDY